jgi:hypothetical protein
VLLIRADDAVGARRTRDQLLLALNDLGREAQVSFAADAFEIVDQTGLP